jgi:hypothetical protein
MKHSKNIHGHCIDSAEKVIDIIERMIVQCIPGSDELCLPLCAELAHAASECAKACAICIAHSRHARESSPQDLAILHERVLTACTACAHVCTELASRCTTNTLECIEKAQKSLPVIQGCIDACSTLRSE